MILLNRLILRRLIFLALIFAPPILSRQSTRDALCTLNVSSALHVCRHKLPSEFALSPRGGDDSTGKFEEVDSSKALVVLLQTLGVTVKGGENKFAKLIDCYECKVNRATGDLKIRGFTVSVPGSSPSLKIGKLYVTLDEENQDCLDIEVEDVEIFVEFRNLYLSKNNWNELAELGFPPEIIYKNRKTAVRYGRLELKGKVIVHTFSKPLNKPMTPDLAISLDSIWDLNNEVKRLSEENEKRFMRPGVTKGEITELYSSFFNAIIKASVKAVIEDIADSQTNKARGKITVADSKTKVRKIVMDYAEDASTLVKEKTKQNVKRDVLRIFGKSDDEEAEEIISKISDNIVESISKKVMDHFQSLLEGKDVSKKTLQPDDIMFADW